MTGGRRDKGEDGDGKKKEGTLVVMEVVPDSASLTIITYDRVQFHIRLLALNTAFPPSSKNSIDGGRK